MRNRYSLTMLSLIALLIALCTYLALHSTPDTQVPPEPHTDPAAIGE